jgi:hypothetical protein
VSTVFISYRRDDASANAGRLCDWLKRQFGADNIFLDTEKIAPGETFLRVLEERLAASDGYCCAGGKVSPTTRERCTGTFARVQEEAQRVCRRKADILIDRGIVTKPPPPPRSDAPR